MWVLRLKNVNTLNFGIVTRVFLQYTDDSLLLNFKTSCHRQQNVAFTQLFALSATTNAEN